MSIVELSVSNVSLSDEGHFMSLSKSSNLRKESISYRVADRVDVGTVEEAVAVVVVGDPVEKSGIKSALLDSTPSKCLIFLSVVSLSLVVADMVLVVSVVATVVVVVFVAAAVVVLKIVVKCSTSKGRIVVTMLLGCSISDFVVIRAAEEIDPSVIIWS